MQTLKIDLVSDVVCPWCAVGDARLQQAMDALDGELAFDTEWHAFVLNPDVPPEGRPILEHLSHKYGRSVEDMRVSQHQLIAVAQDLGLHFEHALERRSWHTFDTHRVLAWAKEQGRDAAFNRALFDAYFGDANNPTDPALLAEIAASLGLERATVADILASDRYADAVQQELDYYRGLGVSSVPSFIVDQTYLLAGAQEPNVLVDAFRQIAAEQAPAG